MLAQRLKYTVGVNYLADRGTYSLLDATASHQTRQLLKEPMLREIQLLGVESKPEQVNSFTMLAKHKQCGTDSGDWIYRFSP